MPGFRATDEETRLFGGLLREPPALKHPPDPETQYTRVWFQNVVVTRMPDYGSETEVRALPTQAVMLTDRRRRAISVLVSKNEAHAIKNVLEKHPDRATVYEMQVALLRKLRIRLVGTFVYDIENYSYLSRLRLKLPGKGELVELVCRPSEAILLSILSKRPIYVKNELMDEFSIDIAEILGQH